MHIEFKDLVIISIVLYLLSKKQKKMISNILNHDLKKKVTDYATPSLVFLTF